MHKVKGIFFKGGGGDQSIHAPATSNHSCRLRNKEFYLRLGIRSGLKKGFIIAFKGISFFGSKNIKKNMKDLRI